MKRNGGKIIWCEPFQQSREKVLNDFVASSDAIVIHPYNDEKINNTKRYFEYLC